MPYYTKITTKIEELRNSKQQNKGYQMTQSTMIRDPKDTATILEYLQSHNSFKYCIASSISNAQLAEEVGKSIIASMEGQTVTKYVLKKRVRLS